MIRGRNEEVIFEQKDMLFPVDWSDTAVQIVAQKFFKGPLGSPARESSLQELIDRVVNTIVQWALDGGYISLGAEVRDLGNEMAFLMLHQFAAFNSPVWFNVGTEFSSNPGKPQCSACFINTVEDDMESILQLLVKEGRIFKDGSGSGVNLSTLRSRKEFLSGGGKPSGPLSFMKSLDINAGQIKSGGKTRRAAKMVILNVGHPDIKDFIRCKADEEKKIPALLTAGYTTEFNAPNNAYEQVFYQNANNSVRVSDEFMQAATDPDGALWSTRKVTDGSICDTYVASDILDEIAQATHECGDPGMQFDDTVNRMNPVLDIARINASNPCSEFMFLGDTSCNLASLNLMKFLSEELLPGGKEICFDDAAFESAIRTLILAQEVLVGRAGYPTNEIEENSHNYRPLGLGFANLGALLMVSGVPYDSDRGRQIATVIASFMGACATKMSAEIAVRMGPFEQYYNCKDSFVEVIRQHRQSAHILSGCLASGHYECYEAMAQVAYSRWDAARDLIQAHGIRNAQVTLLAPTGTIGFMMDCATTGIEPELALVKYKNLVGGGLLKLVNPLVPQALKKLGYKGVQLEELTAFVAEKGHFEGRTSEGRDSGMLREHLAVFDTSFPAPGATRYIDPMGHIKMMEAVQPFLSGAISKTVNVPEETTAADIRGLYVEAWKRGLKSVAIYRNNCKKSQPLNLTAERGEDRKVTVLSESAAIDLVMQEVLAQKGLCAPVQRKMPDTRKAVTHKFRLGNHKVYLTAGLYEDGTVGEIFVEISKEGSTLSGLLDSWATAFSYCLQYGVPLVKLVERFSHTNFDPSGFTPELGFASSIPDYVVRWLARTFLTAAADIPTELPEAPHASPEKTGVGFTSDAPLCSECGALMTRNGSCFKCSNCGGTSGCS